MDAAQTLGKYELRGTLGKGAMGTVYDGWDPAIARRVAIKTVSLPADPDPDTAEEIARFRREAQAAGRLTHPNIVAVYDYGETADMAYIVMEFVDGTSLKAPLDNHERFPIANIQRVMTDLLAGLQFSHERGVVHRDIKPANIMLTLGGQAKIADFGIARIEMSSMTQAGTMLGTPSYMSPEQFRGEVVDARTDVYSAGVVLYQLLTGERPFEGGLTAIMHKVLNVEPPVPSQLSLTVPSSLDAVVKQAMAKRPDDRYPSAAAFAEGIRAALAAPSPPPPSLAQDDSEATLVGATLARPALARPAVAPSAVAPARPVPAPPRPATPTSGRAVPAGTPAPGRSRMPLLIGAGVVAVLVLGAGGWFLLGPSQHAPGPQAGVQSPTPMTGTSPIPAAPPDNAAQTPPASSDAVQPGTAPSAPASTAAVEPTPATPTTAAPTATPAPPTPAPATPAPSPTQEASADLHALRQQLAQALAQAPCTLANSVLQDTGAISISGYAGAGASETLRQQLAGVAGAAPLDWQVQPVDQVFCGALAALRPITALAGAPVTGLSVTLAGGQTTLHDGERIMPRVTMGDFAGEVRVDYLGHDGSVVHLYPTVTNPAQRSSVRLAPGAPLSIGEGGPGRPSWEVGPPYGTDMIIVVASSTPLLTRAPAQNADDNAAPYVRDLAAGIARVRQAGGQVSGTLLLVNTVQK